MEPKEIKIRLQNQLIENNFDEDIATLYSQTYEALILICTGLMDKKLSLTTIVEIRIKLEEYFQKSEFHEKAAKVIGKNKSHKSTISKRLDEINRNSIQAYKKFLLQLNNNEISKERKIELQTQLIKKLSINEQNLFQDNLLLIKEILEYNPIFILLYTEIEMLITTNRGLLVFLGKGSEE